MQSKSKKGIDHIFDGETFYDTAMQDGGYRVCSDAVGGGKAVTPFLYTRPKRVLMALWGNASHCMKKSWQQDLTRRTRREQGT